MSKIILIFQGPDADKSSPFPGHAGKRFAALVAVDQSKLGDHFERLDLLPAFPEHKFPWKLARAAADAKKPELAGRTVMFVGAKVARAFGAHEADPLTPVSTDGFVAFMLPHPSAMNLYWNDGARKIGAQAFFKSLLTPVAAAA